MPEDQPNPAAHAAGEAVRAARARFAEADPATLDAMFREARTHYAFTDREVPDALLAEVWELAKWGPTSLNQMPLRIVFVRSAEAKERLRPCLSEGNVDKTMRAPVTAILAHDAAFYDLLPELFPAKDFSGTFRDAPERAADSARRNGTLQAGYFILAARALGLDCGPMSGFDRDRTDAAFMSGTTWRSDMLCNLGYGEPAEVRPRGPRLGFERVAKIV